MKIVPPHHPQLVDEGKEGDVGAAAAEVAHGVGDDGAGLVAEGGGREVVQQVGQGRGRRRVVLG